MDTKLKSDIAESAVITELLKRGFAVLRPVGDRLPDDLAVDIQGTSIIRIQVKCAWYDAGKRLYSVDVRRTKTNRRIMRRTRHHSRDFDIAFVYLPDREVFYVLPVNIFTNYQSGLSLVEGERRQRKPRSAMYRERWDLLSSFRRRNTTMEHVLRQPALIRTFLSHRNSRRCTR